MIAYGFDILSQLAPLKWRDIEVPCQANSIAISHDLSSHKQHGVDGAHVESCGRNEAIFKFRIPFHNGIGWPTALYPNVFRDFWNACLDSSVGVLVHPEFGALECKCKSFEIQVSPESRDGYDVDVEWWETTENDVTISQSADAPIAKALALAGELDELSTEMDPEPEYDDGSGLSLKGAIKKISGAMTLADMAVSDVLCSIESTIGALNDLIDQVNASTDPSSWEFMAGCKLVEAQLSEAKQKLSPVRKKISYAISRTDSSLSNLAASVGMEFDAFLKLNPRLARYQTIKAGTEYFFEAT